MTYKISEKPISSFHSIPLHKVMNFLYDRAKAIPLYKLADEELGREVFDGYRGNETEYVVCTMGYIHAGSFVTYLVDTYGYKKFELIYNQPNLLKKVEETYGKGINQLESEWLDYVSNQEPLSKKEQADPYIRHMEYQFNFMDESLFKRH